MKDRFSIVISSKHLPDAGTTENAFCLSEDDLARRRVVFLDIGNPLVEPSPEGHEPSSFLSERTGRGNLRNGWWNTQAPIMCCYKLTSIKFQVFGLQYRIEEMVQNVSTTPPNSHHITIGALEDLVISFRAAVPSCHHSYAKGNPNAPLQPQHSYNQTY